MASQKFYLVGKVERKPRTEWRFYIGERGSHDLPEMSQIVKSPNERYQNFLDGTLLWDGTKSNQQFIVLRWQKHHNKFKIMHYFSAKDAAIVWCRGTMHKLHSWDGFEVPEFAEKLPENYLAEVRTIPGIVATSIDMADKALRSDNVEQVKNAMDLLAELGVQAVSAQDVLSGKERQLREKFSKWIQHS